jgi:hypothetical protein
MPIRSETEDGLLPFMESLSPVSETAVDKKPVTSHLLYGKTKDGPSEMSLSETERWTEWDKLYYKRLTSTVRGTSEITILS